MASFAVLKSNLGLHWDVKYTDNVQHNFQWENNKGLLFTMSWSGPLCSSSFFTLLTQDVVSAMRWLRLREIPPPLPQAFITSSSLYKWRILFPSRPRRGRWFLALQRYEIQASILSKNFLEKIINLRVINELVSFRKSHMTAPYFPPADFVTKTLQISWKLKGSGPKVATEVGGEWLGSPSWIPLPSARNSSFCLFLLRYWWSGLFYLCKMSLLMQSFFLIFTQPSWDGYFLLFSPKSSICSTVWKIERVRGNRTTEHRSPC